MNLDEVHLLPKSMVALVVVRHDEISVEDVQVLTRTLSRKNPNIIVLYAAPGLTIETLNYQQTLHAVSNLTDRLTATELASLSLKRIIV